MADANPIFTYTDDDQLLIGQANAERKPWDADCIADLKRRIYHYHRDRQQEMCCYCQRDQHGEFKLVIDTEHILPKEKFRENMFDIWNLSTACKRCNMQIKGQRTDFLVDPNFLNLGKEDGNSYLFLHPNFDGLDNHLTRHGVQFGSKRLVKYLVTRGSAKGQYTYQYFRLSELEVDSFDEAQANEAGAEESSTLDAFRSLVNQLRGI